MKKEIKVEVPQSWSAVTLRDYLKLRKDMETYKDDDEALTACLFHHLAHFPVEYLQQMDIDTYVKIKADLLKFFNNIDLPLQRKITIDGVEYGFEPQLSQMAYGAYLDISKYETVEINDKWAEIMAILYRPITKEMGALYDIKTYNGVEGAEKFLDVTMDVHWGAIFFFNNLLKDLLNVIQKSLTEELMVMDLPLKLKEILQENGKVIHQLSNYHKEILPNLMK
jgi:hypothetical protein